MQVLNLIKTPSSDFVIDGPGYKHELSDLNKGDLDEEELASNTTRTLVVDLSGLTTAWCGR